LLLLPLEYLVQVNTKEERAQKVDKLYKGWQKDIAVFLMYYSNHRHTWQGIQRGKHKDPPAGVG